MTSSSGQTDHSEPTRKRQNAQDDSDSLQLYYHQLADSDPLSAEAEYELWEKIDLCFIRAREILYTFGFVLQEHIRMLQNCTNDDFPDLFPASSFPDENGIRAVDSAMLKTTSWCKEIETLYASLKSAFPKGNARSLNSLRKKAVTLLGQYPVCREKVLEWYNVASVYCKESADAGCPPDLLAEKLCMDSGLFCEKMQL